MKRVWAPPLAEATARQTWWCARNTRWNNIRFLSGTATCTCNACMLMMVQAEMCILLGMSLRVPQFIVDENGGLETKLAIGILESRLCWPASCKICSWKYTEYQLVNAPSTAATWVGQVLGVTSVSLPLVAVSDLVQYRSLVQSYAQIKWEGGVISPVLCPDQVRGRGHYSSLAPRSSERVGSGHRLRYHILHPT